MIGTASERVRPAGASEIGVTVFIAAIYMCDILRKIFYTEDGSGDGFRATALTLYTITAILLSHHVRSLFTQAVQTPLLTALVVLPLLSISWSTSPPETLIRAVMLVGSSLFGFYLAIRYSAKELLRVYAMASFAVAALSFFLIFLVPSMGVETQEPWVGVWNGAYAHKNQLGGSMALSASLITLFLMDREGRNKLWAYAALAGCLVLLFGSKSVTGQITYVLSILAIITIRNFLSLLRSVLVPIMIVLTPLLLLAVALLDGSSIGDIIENLGRDVTLSGRIPLWNAVWPYIENRFWLGYGYEAFWLNSQDAMRMIEREINYRAFYSHNGLLELMLAVGAIGTTVFLAVLTMFIVRLVRVVARFPLETFSAMTVVFFFTFVLRNVSEVNILTRHDMGWCMFIALHLKLRNVAAAMQGQTAVRAHTNMPASPAGALPAGQGRTS